MRPEQMASLRPAAGFRYHDAHRVTQTNFRQQIVQRRELHTVEFTLNMLRWDLSQLAAAAQRVVEQTTPQLTESSRLRFFNS